MTQVAGPHACFVIKLSLTPAIGDFGCATLSAASARPAVQTCEPPATTSQLWRSRQDQQSGMTEWDHNANQDILSRFRFFHSFVGLGRCTCVQRC